MSLGIYKPDQGYWTRVISSLSIGIIGLTGSAWLWNQLAVFNNTYAQGASVIAFMAVICLGTYWFYGMNRGTVDFCIATEGEMKKVNWTTRREIFGSTWVVIVLALSTAMFLFLADLIFRELFTLLGVLVGESVIMESIRGLFDSGAGA